MYFRFILFLFILSWSASFNLAAEQTEFKHIASAEWKRKEALAIIFRLSYAILAPYSEVLEKKVKQKIHDELTIPITAIYLSPLSSYDESSAYYYFKIISDDIKVFDSVSTSELYSIYFQRWNQSVQTTESIPLTSQSYTITVPVLREKASVYLPLVDYQEDIDEKKDLVLPLLPSPRLEHYVKKQIPEIMQLVLQDTLQKYDSSYDKLDTIIAALRSSLSQILKITEEQILLISISQSKPTMFSLLFTVFPKSDDKTAATYITEWKKAYAARDDRLVKAFKFIDFTYPATIPNPTFEPYKTTTTTTPKTIHGPTLSEESKTSTTAGIAVGSVCGALAGIAVLGVAGFYIKKKIDAKRASNEQRDFQTSHSIIDDDACSSIDNDTSTA